MKGKLCDKIVRTEKREEAGFHYTYELILREGERTADWRLPLYSIRVSLTDENGIKSQSEARDLFTSEDEAELFFDRLVRNLATPIDLGYVVEDEIKA